MELKYLKDVVSLSLDTEKCIGCGRCEEVCPHGVFNITNKKAQIAEIDLCIECGACALNCPVNAIEVKAGAGCAAGIIRGWLTNSEPTCDCGCA